MRLLPLLALALLGASCTGTASDADSASSYRPIIVSDDVALPPHESFSPVSLSSEPFSSDTVLGQPGTLVVHDGLLWVVDYSGEPWLHALDTVSGRVAWSGGQRGEGPGQFGMINGLGTAGTPGTLWAFDANARRFTAIDTTLGGIVNPELVGFTMPGRLSRATPFGDGTFFGLQMLPPDSGHAVVVDRTGAITESGEWPFLGGDSVPRLERMLASGGSLGVVLCAHPNGARAAVAYSAAGRIDVFDSTAQHVGAAEVPFPADAAFSVGDDGSLHASRPRFWYRDCTATAEHLFALFSGRRWDDYDPPDGSAAEFVHVFTWDGRLVRVLHLDQQVAQIGVSADGRTLYAVPMGEAAIIRYAVPNWGQ